MADRTIAPKSFLLTADLASYLVGHGSPPDALQLALIEETAELGPVAGMQVAPEQGAFLTALTAALGARHAVEGGTFTGHSARRAARPAPWRWARSPDPPPSAAAGASAGRGGSCAGTTAPGARGSAHATG